MEAYLILKKLNEGTFGAAYLAVNKENKSKYVLKIIQIMDSKCLLDAKQEVKVLSLLVHKHITKFYDSFILNGSMHIVMEYCAKGDLKKLIENRKGIYFPEDRILNWFVQLCIAVRYIHNLRIIHRDIKSKNIFLTQNGCVKLGDFGIAKSLSDASDVTDTCVGTPSHLSPEICENKLYGIKSDIWAVGCVLYEMTCLNSAFGAKCFKSLILKIVSCSYQPIPKIYSQDLKNLISQIFLKDPKLRPSSTAILCKPFLMKSLKHNSFEVAIELDQLKKTWLYKKDQIKKPILNISYPCYIAYSQSSSSFKPMLKVFFSKRLNSRKSRKLVCNYMTNEVCINFQSKSCKSKFCSHSFCTFKGNKKEEFINSVTEKIYVNRLPKLSKHIKHDNMLNVVTRINWCNYKSNLSARLLINYSLDSTKEDFKYEFFPETKPSEYINKVLADIYKGKYVVVQSRYEEVNCNVAFERNKSNSMDRTVKVFQISEKYCIMDVHKKNFSSMQEKLFKYETLNKTMIDFDTKDYCGDSLMNLSSNYRNPSDKTFYSILPKYCAHQFLESKERTSYFNSADKIAYYKTLQHFFIKFFGICLQYLYKNNLCLKLDDMNCVSGDAEDQGKYELFSGTKFLEFVNEILDDVYKEKHAVRQSPCEDVYHNRYLKKNIGSDYKYNWMIKFLNFKSKQEKSLELERFHKLIKDFKANESYLNWGDYQMTYNRSYNNSMYITFYCKPPLLIANKLESKELTSLFNSSDKVAMYKNIQKFCGSINILCYTPSKGYFSGDMKHMYGSFKDKKCKNSCTNENEVKSNIFYSLYPPISELSLYLLRSYYINLKKSSSRALVTNSNSDVLNTLSSSSCSNITFSGKQIKRKRFKFLKQNKPSGAFSHPITNGTHFKYM